MSVLYSSGQSCPHPAESSDVGTRQHKCSDREHRIKRRRQRIEAVASQQNHSSEPGQNEDSEPREQGMGQLLLARSAASMRHLQESLHAELGAVQYGCHQREHERKSAKRLLQEELRVMSLAASELKQLLAASISGQWTAFLDIGVAQDLSAAMGQQQEACSRALSLKINLCAAMMDDLAVKHAHYIETLITHSRELEAYLVQYKFQLKALSEEQNELSRQVFSALSGERSRVFRDCQTRLDAQLEQHAAAEQAFLDKYLVAGNEYQHDLNDASYRAAADAHEQLRERLDGGIQQQEMGLSNLCRFHQQREHHLMYTSRTLHESTEERTALLERQKRHIAMLHNLLHTLKQKYIQAERGHTALDEEITRAYAHNLEVHASQRERVGHYRKSEQAKQEKVLELRSHDLERLLVRLVNLQTFLGCSTQSCV